MKVGLQSLNERRAKGGNRRGGKAGLHRLARLFSCSAPDDESGTPCARRSLGWREAWEGEWREEERKGEEEERKERLGGLLRGGGLYGSYKTVGFGFYGVVV